MSETPALETRALAKAFGDREVLCGVDLVIPVGSICGLVGPNGAGKSTTFALAAGLLRPTRGIILVLGHDPRDKAALAGRIGAMPQDAPIPKAAPIAALLAEWAELGGLSRTDARREAGEWLERVGLSAQAGMQAGALSHGMKVRASLAQAFLGSPDLVLLDEPTAGLDPKSAETVRSIVRAEAGRRTIVVSSHHLAELESLCDHVVMLDRGVVVRQGPLTEFTSRGELVRFTLAQPPSLEVLSIMSAHRAVLGASVEADGLTLRIQLGGGLKPAEAISALLRTAIDAGALVVGVTNGDRLEARYLAELERP
ncbi:MAG: hypothetical protein RL199_1600 [Pseudomonadota bacterium]|jgi:ABC-type multidrug transport system ATPase subunit